MARRNIKMEELVKITGRGMTFWHYHLTLYELVILFKYMEENLKFTKR